MSKNADVHIKIIANFAEYINILSDVFGRSTFTISLANITLHECNIPSLIPMIIAIKPTDIKAFKKSGHILVI